MYISELEAAINGEMNKLCYSSGRGDKNKVKVRIFLSASERI